MAERFELMHHGISGMKWGVRRGPPYPIEDRVLKKGTKLSSVSTYRSSKAYKNRDTWMQIKDNKYGQYFYLQVP